MTERATQEPGAAAESKRGGGLASKARAHKVVASIIAVAAFLGLGGIFGEWAVDGIVDAIRGETPPEGFDELHSLWLETDDLSSQLLVSGGEMNHHLRDGVPFLGRGIPPPELEDDFAELGEISRDASDVAGQVQATDTSLAGPQDDLFLFASLIRDTSELVERGAYDAYHTRLGEPWVTGSAGFSPIFSNQPYAKVVEQDELVRQVSGGLSPIATEFDVEVPDIEGWNRLTYPDPTSDVPE